MFCLSLLSAVDTIDYDVELEFLQSPAPSPIESPITPSDEDIPRDLPPSRRPLMPHFENEGTTISNYFDCCR